MTEVYTYEFSLRLQDRWTTVLRVYAPPAAYGFCAKSIIRTTPYMTAWKVQPRTTQRLYSLTTQHGI